MNATGEEKKEREKKNGKKHVGAGRTKAFDN